MKKIKISIRLFALLVACIVIPAVSNAQLVKNYYFNIDWQLNTPFSTDFADKTSGWGANFEGGYLLTRSVSLGAFFAFHTNNEYIERQTLNVSETASITSDQQHSIFQIPFGAVVRYTFTRDGLFEPYVGAKLGANYGKTSTYLNVLDIYDETWGFYASPEVGLTIFAPGKQFGAHIALYYSHATNSSSVLTYNVDGLNNWGLRLGVAF